MTPFLAAIAMQTTEPLWLEFPGKGQHLVFLAGDEEYRSEESLPMLAKMLSARFGFRCTVLFSINDKGEVDPDCQSNQPGTHLLKTADCLILGLRFRHWPDDQMKPFVDYLGAGKPIIGIRTSTHAFAYPAGSASPYAKFSWNSQEWPGGFGKQILGETWISHWGMHGSQGTQAVAVDQSDPLLTGIHPLPFGETDVYEAHPPPDAKIILTGKVMEGTSRETAAETTRSPMPIAWTRELGKQRIFTTTMGSARDFLDPGLRRLLVNAVHWCLRKPITKTANVDLVGKPELSPFGFGKCRRGLKPTDFR